MRAATTCGRAACWAEGIAFVLAVTGWWFILWYWAPVYANILNVEVLQPLAATFKWDGLSDFLATDNGLFIVCLVTVVLAGYLVSLGNFGLFFKN